MAVKPIPFMKLKQVGKLEPIPLHSLTAFIKVKSFSILNNQQMKRWLSTFSVPAIFFSLISLIFQALVHFPLCTLTLQINHPSIDAMILHKLSWRPLFNYMTIIQYYDMIRSGYRAHSMCNNKYRFAHQQV